MKKIFFLGLMSLCFLSATAQYGTYSVQNKSNLQNEGLAQFLVDGLRNGTTTVTVEYEENDPNSRSMKPEEIDTATMLDVLTQIFKEEGVADDLVRDVPTRVTISDTSIIVINKDMKPMNTYRVLEVKQNSEKNGWDFHCKNGVKITMEQMQTQQRASEHPKVYLLHLPDGKDLQIKLFT